MKIIFTGTSEFAANILKSIKKETDWDIALVISEPAKPAGRKNQLAHSPVTQSVQGLNLKLITPKSIKDCDDEIRSINPDIMIVVAYGQILPYDIFDLPKHKTVNVHPSLLPKLRGPSPIQTALTQGLKETGVSLMLIDEQIDHGPIISQEPLAIGGNDTYLTLESKLADLGSQMLIRYLPQCVSGSLKPQPQNHGKATFTKFIKKEDGQINWPKMSAGEVHNLWRAHIKWPGVFTFFKNKNGQNARLKLIQIEKYPTPGVGHNPGEMFTDSSKNLYIACRDGAVKIIQLQPENSKILTAREFLNGYGYLIGQILR